MTATQDQLLDQDFYLQKTYCKTASLMANSAKSIAVLSGQDERVSRASNDEPAVSCRAAEMLEWVYSCRFATQPRALDII